jgi:CheY-like chemotaxis protein
MDSLEQLVILLVEDDPADQKLIKNSLRSQQTATELYAVSSGEEALEFLCHNGRYDEGSAQPDLILLDLNMPGMGGREFLKQIKDNNSLKQIPVIILTNSNSERDIMDSYKLQAAGYIHKPATLEQINAVTEKIAEYWFVLCKLPPKECLRNGENRRITENSYL